MNDLALIWLFVVPFTLAAALPGPAQGALVGQVLLRGGAAAIPFIMGMVTGNAIWLVSALLGLSSIASQFDAVFVAIKWVGLIYLMSVAWMLWQSPPTSDDTTADEFRRRGFGFGAMLTLGNPKAAIFFSAILPHSIDLSSLTIQRSVIVISLGVMIDTAVQFLYLFGASRARSVMRSPQLNQMLNRISAAVIFGAACIIASRF